MEKCNTTGGLLLDSPSTDFLLECWRDWRSKISSGVIGVQSRMTFDRYMM